jgi:hypothetical protein
MIIVNFRPELIKFGVWLTGHDEKTISQMLDDFSNGRNKSIPVEKPVILHRYAWLSTKGEQEDIKNGALYAGKIKGLPDKYKYLLSDGENDKHYCAVFPVSK